MNTFKRLTVLINMVLICSIDFLNTESCKSKLCLALIDFFTLIRN